MYIVRILYTVLNEQVRPDRIIRDVSQARTLSGRRPPPPRGFCLCSRFSWLRFHHLTSWRWFRMRSM